MVLWVVIDGHKREWSFKLIKWPNKPPLDVAKMLMERPMLCGVLMLLASSTEGSQFLSLLVSPFSYHHVHAPHIHIMSPIYISQLQLLSFPLINFFSFNFYFFLIVLIGHEWLTWSLFVVHLWLISTTELDFDVKELIQLINEKILGLRDVRTYSNKNQATVIMKEKI